MTSKPVASAILSTPGCGTCKSECSSSCSDTKSKLNDLAREMRDIIAKSLPSENERRSNTLAIAVAKEGVARIGSDADTDTYYLKLNVPVPLLDVLSHREVLGMHLWVGVEKAVVVVLGDLLNGILNRLVAKFTLSEVINQMVEDGHTYESSLTAVKDLIAKLSYAGFLKGIEGNNEERPVSPNRFARFHLTKACQLECIHCYADSSPYVDRTGEMSTERWLTLVDEFARNKGERILFTGGEALIHKGCLTIMRRAKERGLHVTLFTNGILVKKYANEIAALADQVQISLDGPDEATNDQIRGKGTYRKITEAIDILLNMNVNVRIGMSVMDKNWEMWKSEFLNFAKRYEGKNVEFRLGFGITHYGRGGEMEDNLDPSQTQPEVNAMLAKVKGGMVEDESRTTRKTKGCGYNEQLVIGPDGTVFPCHLLDAPITHVDSMPLNEILQTMVNMATHFDVDHCEDCKDCDIRYLCGGTCRVLNGKKNGSRLITTCTDAEKERRYRNLVRMYS